jgi:peptidoglycan hydrolase-like protein with peptidoglycan-binding domain
MASEWPLQQVGSTGVDVRTVQHLLTHHGHAVAADGVFGPVTQAAVTDFQAANGLATDGVVGPLTWTALVVQVSTGSTGQAVTAAQGQLRSQGWRLAVDGGFGPITEATVRDYQIARCIVSDGVVGPITWQTLVADFIRVPTPEEAAGHLRDARTARDRRLAMRNATLAAVDLVFRSGGGGSAPTCGPNPQLGPEAFDCVSHYEGGAVHYNVEGNPTDGYFVESVRFFVD